MIHSFPRLPLIHDILKERAHATPLDLAFTFDVDGKETRISISYSDLHTEALRIANGLHQICEKGDRVILFFSPGLDFIKAFLGCLYIGAIAVPSYPPKKNRGAEKISAIYFDANPSIILADSGYLSLIRSLDFINVPVVNIEQLLSSALDLINLPVVESDDLAFLQYTSGSTGSPKGVMISHTNLMHNESLIQKAFQVTSDSVIVGWLPFYHDMGLIGNILQSIYSGAHCILMSPVSFVKNPIKWLSLISEYKATISGGPNFAYDLCCEKIADRDLTGIRLDSWKVAFNGAEPVQASTLKRFYEKFKKIGFAEQSFFPCYGMAEATLLVSSGQIYQMPKTTKFSVKELQYQQEIIEDNDALIELVSCGKANEFDLILVNQDMPVTKENQVGEIWIHGDSVARGYWNKSEEINQCFNSQVTGSTKTYYRTGDLGIFKNGELYIAGRIKDLVIISGKNYFPQDIEHIVSQVDPHIISSSVAAFGISSVGAEELIIVAEIENNGTIEWDSIIKTIRKQVFEEFDIVPTQIVFVRKGTLPKTSSGKIQRYACKNAYLNNTLYFINSYSENNGLEQSTESYNDDELIIKKVICDELKVQLLAKDTDLFYLGIDSIALTRIAYKLESIYQKKVPIEFLSENNTIEKIAHTIYKQEDVVSVNKKEVVITASKLQESIWYFQQRNLQSTGYHIPIIVNFDVTSNNGELVKKALEILINRHEVLRTNFYLQDSLVVQKVNPILSTILNYVDLSYLDEDKFEDNLLEVIGAEAKKVFDLGKDLLVRSTLIKKSSSKFILAMIFHHIIVDGRSISILTKEIKDIYSKLNQGILAEESKPAFDFFDYVLHTQKKEFQQKKEFWQNELKGELPKITFPLDYTLSDAISREGESYFFSIEKGQYDILQSLIKETKVNFFSILLTTYSLLIYRFTGSFESIVGVPVSLRTSKQIQNVIGLLINTVMFRSKLSLSQRFIDLIKSTYHHSREILAHADYPLSNIINDLDIPIQENQLAISSVFFNYLDFASEYDAKQLFEVYHTNAGTDLNFDLNLYVLPTQDGINFRFDYCKNYFRKDTITLLADLYKSILDELCHYPNRVIGEMRAGIIEKANSISPNNEFDKWDEHFINQNICDRFTYVVNRYPERIALKTTHKQYSYLDVQKASDKIADKLLSFNENQLQAQAIGLLLGQEDNMVFSILGVLKSSNYYLPLDVEYPSERLEYIVEDANINTIITNNKYISIANQILAEHQSIRIINLDDDFKINHISFQHINIPLTSLAYILYTSGSTGTPKGVMQTHEYVMHLTLSFTNSIHISKEDCFTLIPSFSFSASVMDLFGALLNGASLFLTDLKKEGISPILDEICNEGITIYHSVPTIFRSIASEMDEYDKHIQDKLRLIYLAGEPLYKSDFEIYKKHFPDKAILVNALGCTEFNICRQNFMNKQSEVTTNIIPVGYKAIGVEVLIVDQEGNETLNCEVGEIAVKSKYLAKGYLNAPDLTQEKFKTIDISDNTKIYYTGDLGRKKLDGSLMHLGRKDFQVKLRGQRIELSEIEVALQKIEDISQALVVLKEVGNEPCLCGYYLSNTLLDPKFIKTKLSEKIPSYMIPSYFVRMDSFPKTSTGKIDRLHLPLPNVELSSVQNNLLFDNSLSEIEVQLISIWEDILSVESSHIIKESNFFELGGNSLSAIKLLSKINREFDSSFSMTDIFQNQTLGKFAELIADSKDEQMPSISSHTNQEYYPLSQAQLSIYIQSQVVNYNITRGFLIKGQLNISALEQAFQLLIDRHEILRTVFFEKGGNSVQKIFSKEDVLFKINFIPNISGDVVQLLKQYLTDEIDYLFNLEVPPLLRVTLIAINGNEWGLILNIHHIISDGWSMKVLSEELWQYYNKIIGQSTSSIMEPLAWQYKDFSVWHNNLIEQGYLKEQKEYWVSIFKEKNPLINLPFDRPRKKIKSFEGRLYRTTWDQEISHSLISLSPDKSTSIFSSLVACLNILFYKYTGICDILLGTLITGRERKSFEDQIGFYANMLGIRTKFIPSNTYHQVLESTNQSILDAFKNQDFPINLLAEELHLNRELNRSLFFDIVVIFHGSWGDSTRLVSNNNLTVTEIDRTNIQSKFDITFNIFEVNGQLQWDIEYCTALFDEITIEIMMQKLKILTSVIIQNPKQIISDYDIRLPFEKESQNKDVEIVFSF